MSSQVVTKPMLMDIAEIESATQISQRTIWRWISAGKFPKPDIVEGRVRRWRVESIHNWIDGQSNQEIQNQGRKAL